MNSTGHLIISLTKSAIRLIGLFFAAVKGDMNIFFVSFVAAELLGIGEELVDKRG